MSGFEENLEARETKTLEETDKKCPSCGGVMEFDPTTGGLACPYCGHTEEIRKEKTQPAKAQELDLDKAEQTVRIQIPDEAFKALDFGDNKAAVQTDLMTGENCISTLTAAWPYQVVISAYSGRLLKFTY